MIAITVTFGTIAGGGFDASSRAKFVALAGLCLLVAGAIDAKAVVRAARAPLSFTLTALALISICSAAWTVGSVSAALLAGLVIAGYAAVLLATAALAEAKGPSAVAAALAVLALLQALLALHAVAFHMPPDAERFAGTWRPGGSFEYPPALALLEVGALPVLSAALAHRRASIAAAGAAAATLAGVVLGTAGSRLALGLAAAVLLALIFRPRAGRSHVAAIGTTCFVVIGALTGPALLGGDVGPGTPGSGAGGVIGIAALALAGSAAWLVIGRGRVSCSRFTAGSAIAAIVAIAVAASGVGSEGNDRPAHAPPTAHRSDVLHGRAHEWSAAIETALDRPLAGAGAGAYYIASLPHQTVARSRFAHDLPLELAAELGVLGLLLGLAIYLSTAWTIARATQTSARWLLAPLVAAFLASNLVDWTWHLAGLGSLWAAASGALLAARR